MLDTPCLSSLEGCELSGQSGSQPRGFTFVQRVLVVIALVAVAFGASMVAPSQAEAVTWNGCNWAGFCSVKLNKKESNDAVVSGVIISGVFIPWYSTFMSGSGQEAFTRSKLCLQFTWNKYVVENSNSVPGIVPRIVPTTYRCG